MRRLNTVISSRINMSMVLSIIYNNPLIARSQIAEMTGLNASAVTHILNKFLARGLVEEVGEGDVGPRRGRKPINLKIVPHTHYVIAIEIERDRIMGLVADLAGREVHRSLIEIDRNLGLIDLLTKLLDKIRSEVPNQFAKCVVISIGSPGVVNHDEGILVLTIFHGYQKVRVGEALENRYQKLVLLENDANAAALGEISCREEKDPVPSLLFLYLRGSTLGGTLPLGLGGAMVMNGRLWRGAHYCSGETYSPADLIIDKTNIQPKPGAQLSSDVLLRKLMDAVGAGELKNVEGEEAVARKIGLLLAVLASFFDPEAVMVNIANVQDGQPLLHAIQSEFEKQYTILAGRVRFEMPRLGSSAVHRGLIAMGLRKLFVTDPSEISILFKEDQTNL